MVGKCWLHASSVLRGQGLGFMNPVFGKGPQKRSCRRLPQTQWLLLLVFTVPEAENRPAVPNSVQLLGEQRHSFTWPIERLLPI